VRAEEWDERYAERQQWSSDANALVAGLLDGLPPGDAVDLAAGEGRHALWLADRGWRVTAVDFSAVGLDRGRAQDGADRVTWVTADVTTWAGEPAGLDLVLVAYLHLPEADTLDVLTRAVGWLRPGGRLLVLGHDVENLTAGVGGPQEPAILHSVDRLGPVAALLEVDRLEQVRRETPAGTALDTLLWGRRPAGTARSGGSVRS
jgi:SAM-dependent methyltransferase